MTAGDIGRGSGAHGAPEPADRVLDAALSLVSRWGVAKTTLRDVAREAGCSRATLYRAFPGGKQQVFAALGARELRTYLQGVVDAVEAADDLEDAVTRALVVAARQLRDHEAAQFVLVHEPKLVLPFLGFRQVDRLYAHTGSVVGPPLERFLPPDRARWLSEWAARTFVSYLFNPDPGVDLASVRDTRDLVARFVLPSFAPVPVH